ncbi:MAG: ABC transporter permease [Acidimicrobiia bacterium]|nr:ABC transporter permease [Acidimicrobiia bacterium]
MATVTSSDRPGLAGWRSYLRDLWSRREFAWFLASGNLKARNASTALGLAWWVLNPLIMAGVYFLVFGFIFNARQGEEQYLAYLLSGMFAFNFMTMSMTGGANSILANSKLLINVRFPRLILPISGLAEALYGFLSSLLIFYVIVWPVDGVHPTMWVFLLPVVVVLQTVFNLGLAALTARLAVPFRDINNLIPHLNRLWMYLSPIIWPMSFVADKPEWFQWALRLNPMYSVIVCYRTALMGREFEPEMLIVAALWAVVMGVVGVFAFVRYEGNMVRHL